MPPLQKHIADKFEEKILDFVKLSKSREDIKSLVAQLLSIARGEVEKKKNTVILGTEESSKAYKHKTDGYHKAIKDVLDTLTITKE